jgi:hypothetical protein
LDKLAASAHIANHEPVDASHLILVVNGHAPNPLVTFTADIELCMGFWIEAESENGKDGTGDQNGRHLLRLGRRETAQEYLRTPGKQGHFEFCRF